MRRSCQASEWRGGLSRLSGALVALAALLVAAPAFADLRPPPKVRRDPPMRIVHVTSSDPACEPNCPEWISAEGIITPGSAGAFRKAIVDLGGRRLPVLISSHGGSLRDAFEMGELIRERRLAVAVARTLIENCPERAPRCPGAKGQAIASGAFCASACPLILAAGVERLVGPVPMVGVHQITEVLKEEEGLAHLKTIKKIYEPDFADNAVKDYLIAMGVGDPVMALLRKTPASSIRWLSLPEISESHLATGALDAAEPMLTSGANGLNGHAFDGDPARPDTIAAKGAAPLPEPGGAYLPIETTLIYRRGGGTVEVALAAADAAKKAGAQTGWTLASGGDPLQLKASADGQARGAIPRERFCALARDGKLVATPGGSAAGAAQPRLAIDLAAMDGATALVAEACP